MAKTPRPIATLDLALLRPDRTAFFLDFDGTLADFNDDPSAVFLPERERRSLAALAQSTQAAVAVISGRAMADIDRMLAPLKLPVAGVHGLERRGADGEIFHIAVDEQALAAARERLQALVRVHPGLLVEEKPGSLALHFRRRPELEARCLEVTRTIANEQEGLQILRGKMVIEFKAGRATKADAIDAFMEEDAFRGRQPFFAGDDATDEDVFVMMPGLDGISVKVGSGPTAAAYRAKDIDEFRDWLSEIAGRFAKMERSGVAGD